MILGIDTSNYTTSVALYNPKDNSMHSFKKLLPVPEGQKGLRQSDAVFHHTMQIRELITEAFKISNEITAVGVSVRPCDNDGSYMPCFMVGETVAISVANALNVPLYRFSHQCGHIAAALFSADRLDLIDKKFIAFHFSGGTSDALIVSPDRLRIISCDLIAKSTDLKAGQAVDRAGVMLGLPFPAGQYLDKLARESTAEFKIKPSFVGNNPSFSGVENKAEKMLKDGKNSNDIAKFVISYVESVVIKMTENILNEYGELPIVYAGGVMCNSIIRESLSAKFNCYFAKPEFSSDNAAGAAILAYEKEKINGCR